MLKEESVGDRTRCLNLFPPPWAHSQSVGWAQEHKGTPHKGTREHHTRAQVYKGTLHMGTPHMGTQGYSTQGKGTRGYTIANYWLWVRHRSTSLQLFIISCTLVCQKTKELHCIFTKLLTGVGNAYCWTQTIAHCILVKSMYTTLCVGRASSSVAGQQSCLSSSYSVADC